MARSKSSGRWLAEHFQDEYVKRAQDLGYRSRAVFKLMEIQERDGVLRPGMRVLDLGAAPGGWSQFAAQQVGVKGAVIASDILPMDDLPGVTFIQGDFREETVLTALHTVLAGHRIDVVLSDMAPNMSGNRAVDQPRSLYLAELALEMAEEVLDRGGAFLVKLFQGSGTEDFQKRVRQSFDRVVVRKPKASRARSNEVYLLARGFK